MGAHQEGRREQREHTCRHQDHVARAEVLDEPVAGDEGAENTAERGHGVHGADHVAGAGIAGEREGGQERRDDAEHERR